MAFTKITNVDTANKGVVGLPDTPGLSTAAMQAKFDELATDVIIPKHNSLIDELEATTAAASIGSVNTPHASGANVQALISALDTAIYSYVDGRYSTIQGIAETAENEASNALYTAGLASSKSDNAVTQANNAYSVAQSAYNKAAQVEVSIPLELENLKTYVDGLTHMNNPTTGTYEDLATVITDLYNYMRPAPLTAKEYDDLGLTAAQYDAYGLTAYQYDMLAKQLLV